MATRTCFRRRQLGCWLAGFLLLIAFSLPASLVSATQDIAQLKVREAYANGSSLRAYLSVRDAQGQVLENLSDGQVAATLGSQNLSIKNLKQFKLTGDGVGYIFLVDISKSLNQTQFRQMKEAMQLWVDGLGEKDRVTLVTFGETVKLIEPIFTNDKVLLHDKIASLAPTDNSTLLNRALKRSLETGQIGGPDFPERRALIIISDGEDTEKTGGAVKKEQVLQTIADHPLPIYAMGTYNSSSKRENLDILAEYTRESGGEYYEITQQDLGSMYEGIKQDIFAAYRADFIGQNLPADGQVYRLTVTITGPSGQTISNGLDLRMQAGAGDKNSSGNDNKALPQPSPPVSQSSGSSHKLQIYGGIALGILIIAALSFYLVKRRSFAAENTNTAPLMSAHQGKGSHIPASAPAPLQEGGTEPPAFMVKITFMSGGDSAQSFDLAVSDSMIIGGSADTEGLSLPDEKIAPQHCQLVVREDQLLIENLAENHDTLVNGVPIKGLYRLQSGDVILLGATQFRISFS
ncbi:MAG TPA: FHA domain-containing protein [Syntrophomonadaceae bacterium]|nr:FHA domain-containing protein [Syntrophomonadaceae bacterium]